MPAVSDDLWQGCFLPFPAFFDSTRSVSADLPASSYCFPGPFLPAPACHTLAAALFPWQAAPAAWRWLHLPVLPALHAEYSALYAGLLRPPVSFSRPHAVLHSGRLFLPSGQWFWKESHWHLFFPAPAFPAFLFQLCQSRLPSALLQKTVPAAGTDYHCSNETGHRHHCPAENRWHSAVRSFLY